MSRWAPGAAARLHDAAMTLFAEQGFAETTVPQIAERAGLTTRTFFRWYADKREVLFVEEDLLPEVVAEVFARADPGLAPLEIVRRGFREVLGPRLDPVRPQLLARHRIVQTDDGLRERYMRKTAILTDAARRAYALRGLAPVQADLAARMAVAMWDAALERWLEVGGSLADVSDELFAALPDLGEHLVPRT